MELLALLVGIPAVWVGGTFMASLAGWRQLGQRFRTDAEPKGEEFVPVTGILKWAVYRNLLRVRITAEGLLVAPVLPILVGHPPLLFPWASVLDAHTRGQRLFPKHEVVISGDGRGEPDRAFRLEDERVISAVRDIIGANRVVAMGQGDR